MKPSTHAFPVSIGDRVFCQRLGRAGHVVALQASEKVGPMAKVAYLNNEGDLKSAWLFCDLLRDTKRSSGSHGFPSAFDIDAQLSDLKRQELEAKAKVVSERVEKMKGTEQ